MYWNMRIEQVDVGIRVIYKTAVGMVAIFLALTLSCSGRSVDPSDQSVIWEDSANQDQFVTMHVGQSSMVPGENFEIGFAGVTSDSRCPMNAYCFWPGIGEVNLWMRRPGGGSVYIKPSIIGTTNVQKEGDHIPAHAFGYEFAVMNLTPYPPSQHPIEQSSYRVRIRVRKAEAEPQYPDVIVTHTGPETVLLDHFGLNAIEIAGRRIDISLSYSGGCGKHSFGLYMAPGGFAKSNPVQADLYVRHYAQGDACRAWITETVSFDLDPVIELHRRYFGENAPIVINVFEYFSESPGEKLSATYEPN